MTEHTISTDSVEPVNYEKVYLHVLDKADTFALHMLNESMDQLSDLDWTPAEIVERVLDFFDVVPDQNLLAEIEEIQAERAEETTVEYSPEVLVVGGRGEPDAFDRLMLSRWGEGTILRDGNEILTAEQEITISIGSQKVNLRNPQGFTRRELVDGVCKAVQAQGPCHPPFLDTITVVDGAQITFSLWDR
jgi:hypothetical protein